MYYLIWEKRERILATPITETPLFSRKPFYYRVQQICSGNKSIGSATYMACYRAIGGKREKVTNTATFTATATLLKTIDIFKYEKIYINIYGIGKKA